MKVLLTTLHAKYSHASLALPCLAAYCGDLHGIDLAIKELTVNEPSGHLLRLLMAEQSDVVAFSCYIWNIELTLRIAANIKKIAPQTRIVLGGPEASFAVFDLMAANPAIDYVIKGEGELPFRHLLEALATEPPSLLHHRLCEINNLFFRDGDDVASGPSGSNYIKLDSLPSPFASGLVDQSKPLVYYETSRGCPFSCAFCLSSVERTVRSFSMARIKEDLLLLMNNNVANIKLVDRTFNFDAARADEIWQFIIRHNRSSHFHFEIAADLLTESNITTLKQVPANTFRFEIGVQSTSQETLAQVKRHADLEKICSRVRQLVRDTAVELHLDLIAGLPGENYEGFLDSLETIAALHPHDIQIEPLKLLKGSPMREIARREGYAYCDTPPYTILHTPWLSYADICRIETIGRLLDLFSSHGGLTTAFRTLQRTRTFAEILDRMARLAATDNLASLSSRRVFELCARLAEPLTDDLTRPALYDALFYDYCLQEMPLMGKLPTFITDQQQCCAWPGHREIPATIAIPSGCRAKIFRYEFLRDYRSGVCAEEGGSCTVTFVYISGAGRGLQVLTSSTPR
jgi:anaerobic magnesium-protoporphyrin IX monomethyl ester cyclase